MGVVLSDIIPQFSKGLSVRQLLFAFASVLVVTSSLHAQGRDDHATERDVTTGTPAANGIGVEGGVGYINPGTPVLRDNEINSQPVPRLPDGHIDLTGPWVGGGAVADIERDGGLKPGELPLLPWAKELRDKRKSQDDPYTACLPMGPLRTNPYPWKLVMSYTSKGLTHIFILHELMDDGVHRTVFMDGRKHPAGSIPSWVGHSIGRWDGDALVVDTVGFNDRFWFDRRGTPHTEQLHVVERYTRKNFGTLENRITIDDAGAYAKPFTITFTATLRPHDELIEYICNENNQDIPHVQGPPTIGGDPDRPQGTSAIP
jgi:hypothetical protein